MPKKTSLSKRLNKATPAQIFYTNIAVLSLSIILLGLSIWIKNQDDQPQVPFRGYSQGVTVSTARSNVTVNSVTTSLGQGRFTAPTGKHYIIVGITVKNTSDKPINVLPSTDTYAKSTGGKVTFLTPYNLEQPFRAGELLPGEQITGQLSFLVPLKGVEKLYVDSIWSGGVITFALQS